MLFIVSGLRRVHLMYCGYIFVEIFKPQEMSQSFLAGSSISLIMVLFVAISFVINFKQMSIPSKKFGTILMLIWIFWLTLSTYYSLFDVAWVKYDFVVKSLVVLFFVPFILNSQVKIDTFLAVLASVIFYFTFIAGVKTLFGGGGYGVTFIQTSGANAGMAESSYLSMVALMNIPLTIYILKHSVFSEPLNHRNITYIGVVSLSGLTIVGSYARTGLVGLVAWMLYRFKDVKGKFKYLLIFSAISGLAFMFVPDEWLNRMATINSANSESSAVGRLVVWEWTLDFAKVNPFMGGGFYAHLANAGELDQYLGEGDFDIGHKNTGKAFHSIYFEVLGEQGYVGLAIFLIMIFYTYKINQNTLKSNNFPEWKHCLAGTLNQILVVYCVCGAFINIAFFPWLYILLGVSAALACPRTQ
jgi:probable O-glycosylation ligase (exosortase A-associated)